MLAATGTELLLMQNNKVWELSLLPNGFRSTVCEQIYKTKKDSKGKVAHHKASLVQKGLLNKMELITMKLFPQSRLKTPSE